MPNKVSDHIHEELLALQTLAAADIAFYKQQQWRVCNHALAIYVAIIAVPKLLNFKLIAFEYFILGVIAFTTLIAGIILVREMESALAKGRDRLPALRRHFDREISLKAYAADEDPETALLPSEAKVSFKRFFYFVLTVGFVLTLWLLIRFANLAT